MGRGVKIAYTKMNWETAMDEDSPRRSDTLKALTSEDLDRHSVAELETRIQTLEGEIARVRAKLRQADASRAAADALFRR